MSDSNPYRLVVVQNPVRARCCGFGEKDRRLVDPPPILQLFEAQPDGSFAPVTDIDAESSWVVHCDLYDATAKENRSTVYVPSSVAPDQRSPQGPAGSMVLSLRPPQCIRNLLGTLSANAVRLFNERHQPGVYFVFHDLSIRTEGRFRLNFMMLDLRLSFSFCTMAVQSDVLSEPFTVFTAKKFPGMTESTPLSRAFADQGVKIITRREPSYTRTRTSDQYYRHPPAASSSSSPRRERKAHNLSIADITLPTDVEPLVPSHNKASAASHNKASAASHRTRPITPPLVRTPTGEDSSSSSSSRTST